jgi:hypothetical protein
MEILGQGWMNMGEVWKSSLERHRLRGGLHSCAASRLGIGKLGACFASRKPRRYWVFPGACYGRFRAELHFNPYGWEWEGMVNWGLSAHVQNLLL